MDRYYTKLGAALAHLGCVMIFWRVVPAPRSVNTRKFEYCRTTQRSSVAFRQRVLLAASQIAGAILRKNLARKFGVFLLNHLRTCRSGPLYDNERGALPLRYPSRGKQSRGWPAGACPRALDPGADHDEWRVKTFGRWYKFPPTRPTRYE